VSFPFAWVPGTAYFQPKPTSPKRAVIMFLHISKIIIKILLHTFRVLDYLYYYYPIKTTVNHTLVAVPFVMVDVLFKWLSTLQRWRLVPNKKC
jgi:hypothetical protein